jgi:hypothetical protein
LAPMAALPQCHPNCVNALLEDDMRNFEFSLMELVQRTDAALAHERRRSAPDPLLLSWLKLRREQLRGRLRKSILQPQMAGV